ncbi:hypothetical protein [Rhizobium sp. No.120]
MDDALVCQLSDTLGGFERDALDERYLFVQALSHHPAGRRRLDLLPKAAAHPAGHLEPCCLVARRDVLDHPLRRGICPAADDVAVALQGRADLPGK